MFLQKPEDLDTSFIRNLGMTHHVPNLRIFSRTLKAEAKVADDFTRYTGFDAFMNWNFLLNSSESLPEKSPLGTKIINLIDQVFPQNIDNKLSYREKVAEGKKIVADYYAKLFHHENFDNVKTHAPTNITIEKLREHIQFKDHKLFHASHVDDAKAAAVINKTTAPDSYHTWLVLADAYSKLPNNNTPLARKLLKEFNEAYTLQKPSQLRAKAPIEVAGIMEATIKNWYAHEFRKEMRLNEGAVFKSSRS